MAKLFGEFDGHIQNHTTISDKCKECESEKEIWERKRDLDREFFRMILENENVNEDVIGPNDKWYIIDADWLSHWKAFIFDDGNGNLLYLDKVVGSIDYDKGHCEFTVASLKL